MHLVRILLAKKCELWLGRVEEGTTERNRMDLPGKHGQKEQLIAREDKRSRETLCFSISVVGTWAHF